MVIKRIIHSLRNRSHDERRAFAGICSLAMMGVFFVGWSTFFFGSMNHTVADQSVQQTKTDTVSAQTAAVAAPSLNSLVETIYTDNTATPVPADTSNDSSMNTGAYPNTSQQSVIPTPSSGNAAEQLQSALQ